MITNYVTVEKSRHSVILSFAETEVWDQKPVLDLINAKTEVTLSFGLRLKSQTKLRANTKV